MTLFANIETALTRALPERASSAGAFLERPRDARHGDIATGLAMRAAKQLGINPREVAAKLIAAVEKLPEIESAQLAGPGFVNMRLSGQARCAVVTEVLGKREDFGRRPPSGRRVLLEFVSSNPTGPLHVGHGRGAAIGDCLARIMRFCGDEVITEYYLNDRGLQVDVLAATLWLRVLEILDDGTAPALPAGAYQGEYLRDVARDFLAAHPSTSAIALELDGLPDAAALAKLASAALGARFDAVRDFAVRAITGMIKAELESIGVCFDSWYSEKALDQTGAVKKTLDRLDALGVTYMKDGAHWLRASDFGDDKDRVITRSDGEMTYFATDIAYHLDKGERGRDLVLTLLGQDHHGYVPRILAALTALASEPEKFKYDFIQFVSLINVDERISMSTRKGNYLLLAELVKSIGADATRLHYVLAKGDTKMDIDVAKALRQGNDNPVYYLQYAHARVCALLANWAGDVTSLREVVPAELSEPEAQALLAELLWFAPTVASAAREREPHRVAHGLISMAAALHRYYDKVPILKGADAALQSRLALMEGTRQALANGLALLGVSAPSKMEPR